MADKIVVSMIAAVAQNRVIGADNGMPWRLPADLRRFKAVTMGKPIVMGRRTYESIGKALPGRLNIVVTRDKTLKLEDAVASASLDEAMAAAKEAAARSGAGEIMIAGGGQIYAEAMKNAERLYITHVAAMPDGDTVFPIIDEGIWKIVHEETLARGEKDSADTAYRIYERINA